MENKTSRQNELYGNGEGAANTRKADWKQLLCRITNDIWWQEMGSEAGHLFYQMGDVKVPNKENTPMSYKGSTNFRPILLHGSPKSLLFSVFKM